jgi:hypothetical protein
MLVILPYPLLALFLVGDMALRLNESLIGRFRPYIMFLAILAILLMQVPLLLFFKHSKAIGRDKIAADHVIHTWKNPAAKFSSSMSEELFQEACDFVAAKQPTGNGIYMISKYDIIIPFLSKRYNALPFGDLQRMPVVLKDNAQGLERLRKDKPQIVFTDADIDRDNITDIPFGDYVEDEIRAEALMRIFRMRNAYSFFNAIRADYEPYGECQLLKAWKRKAPNSQPVK